MEFIYKKVCKADEVQLRFLINSVLSSLERTEFFIPYEEWELNRLFDESYAFLHGAYAGCKLIGIAQLYCEQGLISEYIEKLGLKGNKICELGGNLVLPEFRGNSIMYNLIKIQSDIARKYLYDYVIAMAHPENIGSIKVLEKLGLQYVKTEVVSENYLRNMYVMKL